jgi:RNA polymerase-binding protein DksA
MAPLTRAVTDVTAVAKKTSRKANSTKPPARRRAAARKEVATKKVARKRTKKALKATARKPARARATSKKSRAVQSKPLKKDARKSVGKTPPAPVGIGVAPIGTAAAVVPPETPVKRSSNLRKKDLAQFRDLLLAKRAELIGDVSTLQNEALSKSRRDASGDLSSMPIHMADLGTDNYEKEFTLGLIEGSRALLREIDEALARIENGTYGICAATGKPIGKARLRARPWAKFCYEYMLAQERGQQESGM